MAAADDTRKTAKRRALRAGARAETVAAWRLRVAGYRILARRYRCRVGEIDLVARRGRLVAFVEVKQRADGATAAAAISPRQQQRIARAAQMFMAEHRACAGCDMRFDAVLVVPWRWPQHLPGAW